jgi:hypothetical protein
MGPADDSIFLQEEVEASSNKIRVAKSSRSTAPGKTRHLLRFADYCSGEEGGMQFATPLNIYEALQEGVENGTNELSWIKIRPGEVSPRDKDQVSYFGGQSLYRLSAIKDPGLALIEGWPYRKKEDPVTLKIDIAFEKVASKPDRK